MLTLSYLLWLTWGEPFTDVLPFEALAGSCNLPLLRFIDLEAVLLGVWFAVPPGFKIPFTDVLPLEVLADSCNLPLLKFIDLEAALLGVWFAVPPGFKIHFNNVCWGVPILNLRLLTDGLRLGEFPKTAELDNFEPYELGNPESGVLTFFGVDFGVPLEARCGVLVWLGVPKIFKRLAGGSPVNCPEIENIFHSKALTNQVIHYFLFYNTFFLF